MIPTTLRFALRNLSRQKSRTAMTLAAIVFGVIGLILSGGFVEDIFIQLREATIKSRLGHLQVYEQGFFQNGSKAPFDYLMTSYSETQEAIEDLPEVTGTLRRLTFFGLLNNGRSDLPILGEGVEPKKEAEQLGSFFRIIEGRQLTDTDPFGILVGEGAAATLNLDVGDYVSILANTPRGALNSLEFEIVGIFRTFSKDFDARAVRVSLASAQELVAVSGIHALVVSLSETEATDTVAAELERRFEDQNLEVKTWLELDDFYANTTELYKAELAVLQLIILLVVLLSVANSVNMTAQERVGEFGTLKALGRTSSQVSKLIVIENTLLGFLGAALGVALGVGLAAAISAVGIPMPPPPNANEGYTAYIRIVPDVVATAFAIGFFATVASAFLAARSAARVPVVDALRQNV